MKRALANNSVARSGNRGIRHRWNYPNYLYNRSLESLTGQHAREDAQRAFLLNVQAAESGMKDAVLAMGLFYLNGIGVEPDTEQARHWYRKSARQGEDRAMFSLGQIAYDEKDFSDAQVWFTRASDKGHAGSLFWLGKLHWRGLGVPEDRKRAMMLFQKAGASKVPEARRVLRFPFTQESPVETISSGRVARPFDANATIRRLPHPSRTFRRVGITHALVNRVRSPPSAIPTTSCPAK